MTADAIDWDAVAEWVAEHAPYYSEDHCAWCDLVGDASGGPTDEQRVEVVRKNWETLRMSPFAEALGHFAAPVSS